MDRRSFLKGLLAAPAIVRSGILMPVKEIIAPDGVALVSIQHPLTYNEILRATREAFIPKLYQQIYQPSPSWQVLINDFKGA